MTRRYLRTFCAACDAWFHRNRTACPQCGGAVALRTFPPASADTPIVAGDALRPGRAAEW
jgi:hypothetical protein